MKRLHGAKAPHWKHTQGLAAVRIPVPPEVIVPMSMHIGAPAKPVVKAGDEVKVGQLIAEAGGFVSAPIHSGVSGKVKKIDEVLLSTGQRGPAIRIETDGEQTLFDGLAPVSVSSKAELIDAVRASGLVGLGGAAFPASVKLSVKDDVKIDYLLINGAECEPYITSDTRTMLDDAEMIVEGAAIVQKHLGIPNVVYGIEKNKPECIRKLTGLCSSRQGMRVQSLPALYPQGGEKVLIYNITGREVPEGKLPADAGCIVMNCTSLAALYRYISTGMPLVEKCITVDGSAVVNPQNVIAPIGTPIKYLFEFCGGFKTEPSKILYGGPMMGIAVPDTEVPVLKGTNAVLAFDRKDAILPEPTPCIRCGNCVAHCPMRLAPLEIERAYQLGKPEILEREKVGLCMECGCCAFGCPAKRPLVQVMKLSKAMLRDYQTKLKQEAEKKAAKEAAKAAEVKKDTRGSAGGVGNDGVKEPVKEAAKAEAAAAAPDGAGKEAKK